MGLIKLLSKRVVGCVRGMDITVFSTDDGVWVEPYPLTVALETIEKSKFVAGEIEKMEKLLTVSKVRSSPVSSDKAS
ncbi:hypothetical protein AVEN_181416-1 [Araneus ventricosus]|uniref:Uncharacterized protein n=1 Tax=Araneus ventricosus TaxID=182803 RepID=A0A4Y2P8V8_ARAVE|nr:hypothetical protein AVEN_181416-1 [Araneus ventricosus]